VTILRAQPKVKTKRDAKYLRFIASLSCVICGRLPAIYHHVHKKGCVCKGIKPDDTRTIALCDTHHKETHQIGRDTFAAKYDLDYDVLIEAYNAYYERYHYDANKEA